MQRQSSDIPRLLLVEPGLGAQGRSNHFLGGVNAYSAQAKGFQVQVATHRRFTNEQMFDIQEDKNTDKIINFLPYLAVDSVALNRLRHYNPMNFILSRVWQLGLGKAVAHPLVKKSLIKVFSSFNGQAKDRIFFPSGDAEWLLGVVNWLNINPKGARIYFRVMYDDASWHPEFARLKQIFSTPEFKAHLENRLVLLAETHGMAAWIEAQINKPVFVLASPASSYIAAENRTIGEVPTVIIPGTGRRDKGQSRLNEFLKILDVLATQHHYAIDFLADFVSTPFQGVSIRGRQLSAPSEKDYAHTIKEAHVGLMLHEPKIFARRGSGVIVDAVQSALPVVVPSGSSLTDFILEGNGIEYTNDHEAAAAVITILKNFEHFSALAYKAAVKLSNEGKNLLQQVLHEDFSV